MRDFVSNPLKEEANLGDLVVRATRKSKSLALYFRMAPIHDVIRRQVIIEIL
jgi:hypothetical protein